MVHTASTLRAPGDDDVAVIITCHNYGKYLAEAIDSVLRQSLPAAEIIVVDDASEDDTHEVVMRYAPNGVRYIRGEWRASGHARNAGLAATRSPYLVFLDADDMLDTDYLRHGIDVFRAHKDVGIAYTDYRCFGDSDQLYTRPETLDWQHFDTFGDLSVVSVVKREAVKQAGGWHPTDDIFLDWDLFRRMLSLGWKAHKSKALFFYRIHEGGIFRKMMQNSYAQLAGFLDEPISILLSLTGKGEEWECARSFLGQQTFPHERVHLFLLDLSGEPAFGTMVRKWIAQSDYRQYSYFETTNTASIGGDGTDARIELLNRAVRMTATSIVWLLSNTRFLPADTYRRLASRFEANVLSVSAPCSHACLSSGGTFCFCCHLVRGEFLRHTTLRNGPPHSRMEDNFFHDANLRRHYETVVTEIENVLPAPSWQSSASAAESISVVTASDENYAIGLAAMGVSLALSHAGKRKIELTILDGGITEQTKRDLLHSWQYDNMDVRWITPDMSRIQNLPLTLWFTHTTYLRILIPDLLPKSVTKAIYLDCDLLVLKDIEALWDVDIDQYSIGAIRDMILPTFEKAFQTLEGMEVDPASPYFHAGVLLMNLRRWRAENLARKIITFIETHPRNVRWQDQDGINGVLSTSCLPLDPRWNVSVESFARSWEKSIFDRETFAHLTGDPAIVHFATGSKPWHADCLHPRTPLFFEYLDKTVWKGWRPQRPVVETNATEGVLVNTP